MSICEGSSAAFSFDKDAVSFDNLSRLELEQVSGGRHSLQASQINLGDRLRGVWFFGVREEQGACTG